MRHPSPRPPLLPHPLARPLPHSRPLPLAGLLAAVLATWLAACGSSSTQGEPSYAAAIQEAEDAAFEVLRQGDTGAIGIAITTRDRLVWSRTFGVVDRKSGRPASGETLFAAGSISKVLAAAAVMRLVDEGRLELDAPLVRYVPSFRMDDPRHAAITVGMLLDHSAGFPGTAMIGALSFAPDPGYAARAMEALATARLKDAPGHMAVYCNDCFTMVEPLVEAVTGMRYADFVRTRILVPLGMDRSLFALAPLEDGTFARMHLGGEPLPQEFPNFHAAGGLLSTPTDLAAFGRMFLGGGAAGGTRILSAAAVEAMAQDRAAGRFNPVPAAGLAFGLGWDTVREPALAERGIEAWTKSGGTGQYAAQLLVAPRDGLAVVVMAPQGAGYAPLAIAQRVMLRALVDAGRIPAFPAPIAGVTLPEAPAPDGLLSTVSGVYATLHGAAALRAEADGSLSMFTLGESGFAPSLTGLRYRTDGWFTSAARPLVSVRVVEAEGRSYLAQRTTSGIGSYLDTIANAQRVPPHPPLPAAWGSRVGREWLVVNDRPESEILELGGSPRLRLEELGEMPGLILVRGALAASTQLVDPAAGDRMASMFMVIPGNFGRDMSDLEVVVDPAMTGGEEWARWGGYLHRPRETVPVLPAASTASVAIGSHGHAEWRSVEARATPVAIGVSGATAWRLYGPDLAPVGAGRGSGQVVLPPGSGPGHLVVWADPGASVGVTVE